MVRSKAPPLQSWKTFLRNMPGYDFRNGQAPNIIEKRAQAWGAVAWAQHKNGRPTGQWFLAVIGSALTGSTWSAARAYEMPYDPYKWCAVGSDATNALTMQRAPTPMTLGNMCARLSGVKKRQARHDDDLI
jgi:hypothetical protein